MAFPSASRLSRATLTTALLVIAQSTIAFAPTGIPVVTESGQFVDSNGNVFVVPGAEFGSPAALSIDGDIAAVGTNRDESFGMAEGAIHLFKRQPNGVWIETDKIGPTDPGSCDKFGSGVALHGDILLVRQARVAFPGCTAPPPGSGRNDIRVLERTEGGWIQTRTLRYSSAGSISVDGNLAVIGLPDGADVYQRISLGVWSGPVFLRQQGIAGDASTEFFRGLDVGVSDGRVVIGTAGDARPRFASGRLGRANVYERNSGGAWTLTADLVTQRRELGGGYGSRVSIAGRYLAIGGLIYERDAWGYWDLKADLGPASAGDTLDSVLTRLDRNGMAIVYAGNVIRTDVYRGSGNGVWQPAARLRISGGRSLSGVFSTAALDAQLTIAVNDNRIVVANTDGHVYVYDLPAVTRAAQLQLQEVTHDVARMPGGYFNVLGFADTRTWTGKRIREMAVQVSNGQWRPLEPQYMAFGGAAETATLRISTDSLEPGSYGLNRICLRVTDEDGNVTETIDRSCGLVRIFSEPQVPSADRLPPRVPQQHLYRTRVRFGEDNVVYAFADDTSHGNSGIVGIDFRVDGGIWAPMAPAAPYISWGAPFQTGFGVVPPATELGWHNICVRAVDGLGNAAELVQCLSYEVVPQ